MILFERSVLGHTTEFTFSPFWLSLQWPSYLCQPVVNIREKGVSVPLTTSSLDFYWRVVYHSSYRCRGLKDVTKNVYNCTYSVLLSWLRWSFLRDKHFKTYDFSLDYLYLPNEDRWPILRFKVLESFRSVPYVRKKLQTLS